MQCSDCHNLNCKVRYHSVYAFSCNLVVTECSVTQRGNITYSLSWSPEKDPSLVVYEEELELECSLTESSDPTDQNEDQFKVA